MVLSGASDRSVQDAAAQDRVVPPPLDAVAEVVKVASEGDDEFVEVEDGASA